MSNLTITINCCLCSAEHEAKVTLPDGWRHRYGGIDDGQGGFCPRHAKVAAFAAAQCPGCVSAWAECPMFDAFAYRSRRTINESDFDSLRKGICPRRVNGTLGLNNGRIEKIDLSERADDDSGAAFAEAIKEYLERYPE